MTSILGKWDLIRVSLRLFFVQGLLNPRGMQNMGFASAVSSVASRVAPADPNALLNRHLSFFNCNPNLTPLIVGGVLRLEQERLAGKPLTENDIERFKRSLASPLAAMGDLLFLGSLKPLALTFACLFAIYGLPLGLLAVFLLYNLAIISCRLWGIFYGYAKGWELVDTLSGPRFQRVLGGVQGVGATMGGVLVGVIFNRFPQNGHVGLLLGAALVAGTVYLLKRDLPAAWFAVFLFPVSAFLTMLFA